MPDDLAARIAAEARRQGLMHPEWLPRLLELPAAATDGEVRQAVTEFRRNEPRMIETTGSGVPVALADSDVHETAGRAERRPREHRPDGTFAPSRPPGMNEALRALLEPEEADPRFVRMISSPEPEPPAGGAS